MRSGDWKWLFLFNSLMVISLNLFAQEMLRPISRPILLSGNFGELRATHLHSGIDIRTGGVEGLPVVCVKDGQLVRVSVSPTGYGQALYIEHTDGTTTVYGHLQRFIPQIAIWVQKIQYQKESFKIDEDFRAYRLYFSRGDTIAYSGNTGSSGGPHLHFEVRDTKSESTLNPLRHYPIRDTKPPVVRKVYIYSISEEGVVQVLRQLPVKAVAPGQYRVGRVSVAAGKIGIGVFATDYMNDSWNKLGLYDLSLVAEGDTLFRMKVDTCSFEHNGLIHDVKDFDFYKKKETVYRCFGNYQERLPGVSNRQQGVVRVRKDSLVNIKINLADFNGNRSTVTLQLQGKESRPVVEDEKNILRYGREYDLTLAECRLKLEREALFSSVPKRWKVEKDSLRGRPVFVWAEKAIPLFRKGHLFVTGSYDSTEVVCELDATGKLYPLETQRTSTGLYAKIGYLSCYTVVRDEKAPEVCFLGRFSDSTLRFKIKDQLSGIASYRGEVNGKWCLFSYDPRVDILQCSLKEPVFRRGEVNQVRVRVTDRVGNQQEIEIKVKI